MSESLKFSDRRISKARKSASRVWAATATILRYSCCRKLGLDPVKDVNLIQTGSETEVLAALTNGAIDAGTMPPPLDARALTQNFRYVYVAYGPEVAIPYPAANIVTRRAVVEKRSAAFSQFLRTMAEASKVLHTDRESSYKSLGKTLPRHR